MIIGSAIILRSEKHLVFEIQKKAKWVRAETGVWQIGLACMGGNREEGESPTETLLREVREEIGCTVQIDPTDSPFLYRVGQGAEPLDRTEADDNVQFYWEDYKPGYIRGARVAVFSGELQGQIKPEDLAGVLCMDTELLLALAEHPLSIADALSHQAILFEKEPIPRDAQLMATGTVEILLEMRHLAPIHFSQCLGTSI